MLEGRRGLEDRSEGDDVENVTIGTSNEIPRFGRARERQANAERRRSVANGVNLQKDVVASF